jgi:hypothetical protein
MGDGHFNNFIAWAMDELLLQVGQNLLVKSSSPFYLLVCSSPNRPCLISPDIQNKRPNCAYWHVASVSQKPRTKLIIAARQNESEPDSITGLDAMLFTQEHNRPTMNG